MAQSGWQRFSIGLAMAAAFLTAGAGMAAAASPPPLRVTSVHVRPGGVIRVSGSGCTLKVPTSGFAGGGPPQVVLEAPVKVFGRGADPSATGEWTSVLHVPAIEQPGTYRLTATCMRFSSSGQNDFSYQAAQIVVGAGTAIHGGQPARKHHTSPATSPGASRLPAFSRALPAPGQVRINVTAVLESLALAVFLVMLVGFPADIFNRTLEENYAEVRSWFRWLRPRQRTARPGSQSDGNAGRRPLPSWAQLTAFTVVAAVLSTLVDPEIIHREAGWPGKGLMLLVGFAVAIPLTTLAYAVPAERYERKISTEKAPFRTLPLALVIAAMFVVVSQLGHLLPGYVYGLIAGYAAVEGRKLSAANEGRAVLTGAAVVLGLSTAAWFCWEPIRLAADHPDASWPVLAVDSTLSTIVILGIEAIVFGLLPLKFLDGQRLAGWHRWIWALVYGLGMFLFVFLLVLDTRPLAVKAGQLHAVVTVIALFGGFAVFSIAFWAYFRYRPGTEAEIAEAEHAHDDAQPVTDQGLATRGDRPTEAGPNEVGTREPA